MRRMVEVRKLNIIKVIMSIDNDDALRKIESQAIKIKGQIKKPNVFDAVKPIRENITIDQMVKEQNYKPITYQEFRKKADEIEWEETLEELLEMLTK